MSSTRIPTSAGVRLALVLVPFLLAAAPAHRIAGRVLSAREKAVPDATVILFDAKSGLPLSPTSETPWLNERKTGKMPPFFTATTSVLGEFEITGVRPGRYRLIAQSWRADRPVSGILEVNGEELTLDGVVEDVVVPSPAAERVEIRPAGAASLSIQIIMPNNETLLLMSRKPALDPALPIVNWKGPFLQNLLAGNRMPKGKSVVHGLPAGDVHLSLLFFGRTAKAGACHAVLEEGRTLELTDDDVDWSSPLAKHHHTPPQRLMPLYDAMRRPEFMEVVRQELKRFAPPPGKSGFERDIATLWSLDLEQRVTLPGGFEPTLADVLTCVSYQRIEQLARSLQAPPPPPPRRPQ
jgi:hypothetical protein